MQENNNNSKNQLKSNNFAAWSIKFIALARAKLLWRFVDPQNTIRPPIKPKGLDPVNTDEKAIEKHKLNMEIFTEEVAKLYDLNAKATIFLVERLSDEVAWVISDCATPKEMFTALQKEYGKIDKDEKTEINRVKSITCSGIKVDKFICDLSSGINDLRSMGISTAKFGDPEIIDVLINGLVDPRFKELQSSLIVKASIDQDLTPESIKKTIRIFSSKTQIWKNHSTKNQRTPRDNHTNMSQNENQIIRPSRPVLKCDFCTAMNSKNAHTHPTIDCDFRKRAMKANAALSDIDNKPSVDYFILDSGASNAMTPNSKYLINYTPFIKPKQVVLGNGIIIAALGQGDLIFKTKTNEYTKYYPFYKTQHVPDLKLSLIPLSVLMVNGDTISTTNNSITASNSKTNHSLTATLDENNLLRITGGPVSGIPKTVQTYANAVSGITTGIKYLQAHRILGHQNPTIINKTAKVSTGLVLGMEKPIDMPKCVDCLAANSKAKPAPKVRSTEKSKSIGTLTHCDISVMKNSPTMFNEKYDIKFIDDCSREISIYLLKDRTGKSIFQAYKQYQNELQFKYNLNDLGDFKHIKQIFRSDNEKGFLGELTKYFNKHSIKHELSVDYLHYQNGTSERTNQTISSMDRSQREYANMPIQTWGFSRIHATRLKNMCKKEQTPN
jgi:hypothetical protein